MPWKDSFGALHQLFAYSVVLNGHRSNLEAFIKEFNDLTQQLASPSGRGRIRRFLEGKKDNDDFAKINVRIDGAINLRQITQAATRVQS